MFIDVAVCYLGRAGQSHPEELWFGISAAAVMYLGHKEQSGGICFPGSSSCKISATQVTVSHYSLNSSLCKVITASIPSTPPMS